MPLLLIMNVFVKIIVLFFPFLSFFFRPGEEGAKQFEALEVLMLDNNKLTSKVFYSLTNLTKYLCC